MACVTKRNGRYVIDCYDQYGQRYRKTLPKGTTKEEAKTLLDEVERRINRQTFLPEKKVPLFGEVAVEWLEYKKTKVRISTWYMYGTHVKYHMSEFIHQKIDRINTGSVEKWITKRLKENMALGTIRKLIVTMNQIFAYAVRHRKIDSNPVTNAERPRKTVDDDTSNKIRILTPDQIRKLLDSMEDQKFRLFFMTAVLTGMRQGEIIGLKWDDVDFRNSQIHVRRTFNSGDFFPPKTKQSIRSIDIPPTLSLELKKWKLASAPNELNLVFPAESGKPLSHDFMYQKKFIPALKKAGLPRVRFHDLRHSYASLLLSLGENIKYIQTQMGHSSPTVTLDVYSHLFKKENPEAARRLERSIFDATGQNLVTK